MEVKMTILEYMKIEKREMRLINLKIMLSYIKMMIMKQAVNQMNNHFY